MTDRLSILTCSGRLLAAKRWLADGTISEYDSAKYWTLATRTVSSITELSALLTELEAKPQTCLIRGAPVAPDMMAVNDAAEFKPGRVRRSLEYFEDQPLHAMLVDIDKFTPTACDALEDPRGAIDEFINTRLPEEFAGASYHWQLSNSAGHASKGRELRAHLWFWLATPATSAQLTVWAEHVGYEGDVAVFRTVQPHYTAAPVLDAGQVDPFPARSGFVEGLAGDAVELALDPSALQPLVRERSRGERLANLISDDPIAQALNDQGLVRSQARDGALNIACPFAGEHGSGEGAETSTQYFPPHTGGFAEGHFKCLHGTCEGRTRGMFLEKLGLAGDGCKPEDFEAEQEEGEAPRDAKPLKFQFEPVGSFASAQGLPWIIKDVLPQAALAVAYGASGSGKTFAVTDLAMAVARGEPWRGKRTKQMAVAYVVAEGAGGFKKRVYAYGHHHSVDLRTVPMHVLGAAPNLLEVSDTKEVIRALQAVGPVGVVVVDTLAQTTPGANENAGEDMGRALGHCKRIHAATGALVLLVHHSGKDQAKGARGWSGLKGACDAEIEVTRTPTGRKLALTKAKDGADGTEWGFDLDIVALGLDEDGDEITSCVVRETDVPKAVLARVLGPNEEVVNAVIQEFARAQTEGIEIAAVIAEAARRMPEPEKGKRDTRKQRAKRAVETLCLGDDAPYWAGDDGCLSVV